MAQPIRIRDNLQFWTNSSLSSIYNAVHDYSKIKATQRIKIPEQAGPQSVQIN